MLYAGKSSETGLFITEKQPTSIAIGWSEPVFGLENPAPFAAHCGSQPSTGVGHCAKTPFISTATSAIFSRQLAAYFRALFAFGTTAS